MESLFSFVGGFWNSVVGAADDDWADRLNRIYTGLMLACASFFLFSYTSIAKPINCWLYEGVTGQGDYVQDICWISNTYWIPFEQGIPSWPGMTISEQTREKREIGYYQWVTIVLLLEAMFFYVPRLMWTTLSGISGIRTAEIMELAAKRELKQEELKANITTLARYIDQAIDRRTPRRRSVGQQLASHLCFLCAGQSTGCWLFFFYIVVKLCYFGNTIGQIFFLNAFLHVDGFYGIDLLANLSKANSTHLWRETGAFPRVTMCDFLVRRVGNLHRHTVQCVLPVNMFNEKVFIFVWLWIFIVSILTGVSIVHWVLRMLLQRNSFVPRYLSALGVFKSGELVDASSSITQDRAMELFRKKYLRTDGIFVLMLIKSNAGFYVFSEILQQLWNTYRLRLTTAERLRPFKRAKSKAPVARSKTDNSVDDDSDFTKSSI